MRQGRCLGYNAIRCYQICALCAFINDCNPYGMLSSILGSKQKEWIVYPLQRTQDASVWMMGFGNRDMVMLMPIRSCHFHIVSSHSIPTAVSGSGVFLNTRRRFWCSLVEPRIPSWLFPKKFRYNSALTSVGSTYKISQCAIQTEHVTMHSLRLGSYLQRHDQCHRTNI